MDVLEKVKKEREAIERQIAQCKTRLGELDAFVRVYEAFAHDEPKLPQVAPPVSKKAKLLDAAAQALAVESPLTTREILDRVERQGLAIGGKEENRVVNFSSLLGRDNAQRFKNDRAKGWSLRSKRKAPADVGASVGAGERQLPLDSAMPAAPNRGD